MATRTSSAGGWFSRNRTEPKYESLRVLTAAAKRIDIKDRKEARQQRTLRQGWQSEAWNYRDSIGELRYAVSFLANCTARMRLYPAAYDSTGETDEPIALKEIAGVPPEVVAACNRAMTDLGNGRLAVAGLLHSLSTNITVAGECILLGQTDLETGMDEWSIRSVDEVLVTDDSWKLREVPTDPNGVIPWQSLDPASSVVSRIWTPHPRFRLLADSPMRAIMDDCESLLIMRRMIRATGRSRLAGRGLLLVPDELTIKTPGDDNADPESEPFMAALADAMMEPIGDEGVASAVVPIVVRGPGELLSKVQHIDFASDFDKNSEAVRAELVGVIATGLDIPKEVIIGVADLNHWTAWQVDDNTFRHHVEPHVINCCDSLTDAYLRPYLAAAGIDPVWVKRCAFWYDPTELVTHPDQTADAITLHERLVISDETLRSTAGFDDGDAPSKDEIQVRLLQQMRNWPPNLIMEFFHRFDSTLVVAPITEVGTIPGINPSGVDVGPPPVVEATGAAPAPGVPSVPSSSTGDPSDAAPGPASTSPPAVTAAGGVIGRAQSIRLSKKLTQIDRELRARLQTAANAAMLRQLERTGARLRSKVAKDETLRAKISHRSNERVSAVLGEEVVTAAGLSADELMGGNWDSLKPQFYKWTEAAQKNAISTALRIGQLERDDAAVSRAESMMSEGRDAAWEYLRGALTDIGQQLLYSPDPNAGVTEWADLNPDTLVPTGTVRASLARAGGQVGPEMADGMFSSPTGQIGTGATIRELITAGGGVQDRYEWEHGPSNNPFEPHEALDGLEFATFDSDALANDSDFPDNSFYFPGDHTGCLCDFTPLWLSSDEQETPGAEEA